MKDVLSMKADSRVFEILDKRVDTFTPLDGFVILDEKVKLLALKSDLIEVNEDLERIQDQLTLLPTAEKLKETPRTGEGFVTSKEIILDVIFFNC